ncbi:fungal-specific transcription factor domain-containing protein [Phyllosticta capitalensis]|uniref:fungal-specific transcription factor domain-containing protein n=1 Tax=Phyllosticta capitalensis TaxID=121624 RepID=UPI00312DBDD0
MSGPSTADDHKAGDSPPGSKESLNDGRRAYRCRTCHRDFKRSEHCSRHERIHTREKPFECQYCHKRYARKDLVTRHVRTLHPNRNDDASPSPRRASDGLGLVSASPDKTTPQPRRRATLAGDRNSDFFYPDAPALHEQTPPQSRRRPGLRHGRNDFASATPFGDFQLSQPVQDPRQSVSSNATGHPADVLYPSPQSCPDQAYGIGPHAADGRAEATEIPFCDVDFPIDPQLIEPNHVDVGLQLERAASDISFLNMDMPNDKSDEMPSSKRRKVNEPQQAQQPESDYNTIDIFRDFWSDPCAPSRNAHATMPADMTPESLDFAGHMDPFFSQSLDLPTPIQTLYGSLGSDFFLGAMPPSHSPSLPFGQQDKTTKLPEIKVTEEVFRCLHEDFLTRARETFSGSHGFPDQNELQKFIECYISCFHRHLPLIHLASMKLEATPSPLVLAICCIGALYRLERRRAEALCDLATTQIEAVISVNRSCGSLKPAPLWAVQGMLLLSMYGIYSGRSTPTMDTIERMGFLANDYRLRRLTLVDSSPGDGNVQWESWINREAEKRLLCSVFLLSTIISIMFGSNPCITVNEDLTFEMPEGEDVWAAQTEQQWNDVRPLNNSSPRRTIWDAMMDAGPNSEGQDEPDVLEPIPGFVKLVMMHAANVHVWTQQQVSHAFGQTVEYQAISSVINSKSARILEKCAQSLASPARHHIRAEDHRDTLNKDAEASLVFNSEACLRLAHLRLLANDYKLSFDRLTVLVSDDPDKVSSALDAYVASPQQGGIEAATKAYEGFLVPVRVGHLLVRKTAAFNWSVEQAIAFWDCAMFLTKWVHWAETSLLEEGGSESGSSSQSSDWSLEQSERQQLLAKCSHLLREMESEHHGRRNLAAALARSGALFLGDTWVWGVTPRMGNVLTQLADVYERS